ncbi:MAG TPA: TetR/AcrR family transcriptional regulator [Chloroflexota bacterium]
MLAERGSGARRLQIVEAARRILEHEGEPALTMRRLADAIGIRAPSLYKHFPDKAAVELALMEIGLREAGAALASAVHSSCDRLAALATAYHRFAIDHPHLYRLMTTRPLPRERLAPGVEAAAVAPLLVAVGGDLNTARALWGMAHGLALLELDGRLPPDADIDAAWRVGVEALAAHGQNNLS